MVDVPPCRGLGRQCRELDVTLRVADLDRETPAEQDALATWLTGHTERISFGEPYVDRRRLVVDAVIRVPCKYLRTGERQEGSTAAGLARCAAHGFAGPTPEPGPRPAPAAARSDDGRFSLIQGRRRRRLPLPLRTRSRNSLPVLQQNPCADAPCRTADNRRGAACCRDLTLEVVVPEGHDGVEHLLRARRQPHVYEVAREEPATVECQVISACGYLEDDGVSCMLHDRVRPDEEPAKPFVCTKWPDQRQAYTTHPGCRLA